MFDIERLEVSDELSAKLRSSADVLLEMHGILTTVDPECDEGLRRCAGHLRKAADRIEHEVSEVRQASQMALSGIAHWRDLFEAEKLRAESAEVISERHRQRIVDLEQEILFEKAKSL